MESSGDSVRPAETTRDHQRPPETTRDSQRLRETSEAHGGCALSGIHIYFIVCSDNYCSIANYTHLWINDIEDSPYMTELPTCLFPHTRMPACTFLYSSFVTDVGLTHTHTQGDAHPPPLPTLTLVLSLHACAGPVWSS